MLIVYRDKKTNEITWIQRERPDLTHQKHKELEAEYNQIEKYETYVSLIEPTERELFLLQQIDELKEKHRKYLESIKDEIYDIYSGIRIQEGACLN